MKDWFLNGLATNDLELYGLHDVKSRRKLISLIHELLTVRSHMKNVMVRPLMSGCQGIQSLDVPHWVAGSVRLSCMPLMRRHDSCH